MTLTSGDILPIEVMSDLVFVFFMHEETLPAADLPGLQRLEMPQELISELVPIHSNVSLASGLGDELNDLLHLPKQT